MKKQNKCQVENCIPTPASCVQWNGGDIESLGICNGDYLTNIVWEIVDKLQTLAGEDISEFDLDSLLAICNTKAPIETNLVSILNVLKQNNICLKDYIDTLSERIAELSSQSGVNVNLKCYADFDNLGNSLNVTRDELDQLVINKLCSHESSISNLQTEIDIIKSDIDSIKNDVSVNEVSISTCVDATELPTSTQLVKVATDLCAYKDAVGSVSDISTAISAIPGSWTKFAAGMYALPSWDIIPQSFADYLGNVIRVVANLESRLSLIERTCCGPTCDALKLGILFTVGDDTVDLSFDSTSGTYIPNGFVDCGTTIVFTDKNDTSFTFSTALNPITQDGTIEGVNISSLAGGEVNVKVNSKFCLEDGNGNTILTCNGCHSFKFENTSGCCVLTNTGETSQTIVYRLEITT